MINSPMSGKPIMRFQKPDTRLAVSIGHPAMVPNYAGQSPLDTLPNGQSIGHKDDQLPLDVSGSLQEGMSFEDGEQAILV